MSSWRGPARHLDIDESIGCLQFVVFDQVMSNLFEAARIQAFDSQLSQAMGQPLQVLRAFEQPRSVRADYVINSVRKQETAIVRRNRYFRFLKILPIVINGHAKTLRAAPALWAGPATLAPAVASGE